MLLCYAVLINVLSAVLCITDKWRARHRRRRISEETLIIFSAIGGSVGMYITMCLIHHKTRHTKFMLGIPVIIVLQVITLLIIYRFIPELL